MVKLYEVLKGAKRAGIAGHVRPDGDCTGSCLALYQYIGLYFPEVAVDVYLEEIPNSFHMLTGADEICHGLPENMVYDVFFALDCGDVGRLGFAGTLFEKAKKTVCIDHHVSNESFADVNQIVPDASSTSELISPIWH